MKLYLLRHGKAEKSSGSDPTRALTEQGRIDVADVAEQFVANSQSVDLCLVSPYLRAQQTAEIFLRWLAPSCPVHTEAILKPDNSVPAVLEYLDACEHENILLVGHNMLLSELFGVLTEGRFDYSTRILETSELACIECDLPAPDMGKYLYSLLAKK